MQNNILHITHQTAMGLRTNNACSLCVFLFKRKTCASVIGTLLGMLMILQVTPN
jgi:hypothetical protein